MSVTTAGIAFTSNNRLMDNEWLQRGGEAGKTVRPVGRGGLSLTSVGGTEQFNSALITIRVLSLAAISFIAINSQRSIHLPKLELHSAERAGTAVCLL